MNAFTETLMRLYMQGRISSDKVQELLQSKKITKEEYLIILGKDEK